MEKHLVEYFQDFFDMVPANTDTLKATVYRLRYQVYCLETGFEKSDQFPDGLEMDEYDAYSEHYLVRHRETDQYAATARLILPNSNCPGQRFPIESHSWFERTDLLENVPRSQIGEVSRFCVSEHFKRREGESNTLAGIGPHTRLNPISNDGNKRIIANYFTLALITCLVRMSVKHGITHWYAFMELPFTRLLRGLGINFIPLGPLVEYHGRRRPYLIKLADLLSGVKTNHIEVWEMLTNSGKFWQESDSDAVRLLCADGGVLDPAHPGKL